MTSRIFPEGRFGAAGRLIMWTSALTAGAMAGCTGERGVAPLLNAPESALGSVVASPWNAIVAIGGTVPLTTQAYSVSGTPLATVDRIRYAATSASDTLRVRISGEGVVTGVGVTTTTPVRINVFAYKDGVVKGDQVLVQVTQSAIPGATLSLQPVAPDSARLAQGANKTMIPVVRNSATGQSVASPGLRPYVRTADMPRVMTTTPFIFESDDRLILSPHAPVTSTNTLLALGGEGTVWVYADVLAYGTMLRDSVLYTLTYPFTGTLQIRANGLMLGVAAGNGMSSTVNLTLAPGGTVTFSSGMTSAVGTTIPISFAFANPAAATAATPPSMIGGSSGHVMNLAASQSSLRRFLTPGSYPWTATAVGNVPPFSGQTVSGTIVIK